MEIRYFANGRKEEHVTDVDVCVLLTADSNGVPRLTISGDHEAVRESFIHGCLNWPTLIPIDEESARLIETVLRAEPMRPANEVGRSVEEATEVDALLYEALGDSVSLSASELNGTVSFELVDDDAVVHVTGVETYLAFLERDGVRSCGQNGAGSQKTLLCLYGVEILWGPETRRHYEDILLGETRTIWLKMAERMRDVPPGEIVWLNQPDE